MSVRCVAKEIVEFVLYVLSVSNVYTGPTEYLVGEIFGNLGVAFTRGRSNIWSVKYFGHLGLPFTRGRLTDLKLGHLGVQIFGHLGKQPSLELGRSSSRTAPCERLWPAEYLHCTTKRV